MRRRLTSLPPPAPRRLRLAKADHWMLGMCTKILPQRLSDASREVLIPGAHVGVLTRHGEVWIGRVCEHVGALKLLPFGASEPLVFAFDDLIYAHPLGPHGYADRRAVACLQAKGEPARRVA